MKLHPSFLRAALPNGYCLLGKKAITYDDLSEHWTQQHVPVCIDSRLIKANDFFIPLKGQAVDGHQYIAQALEKGAVGSLVARSYLPDLSRMPQELIDNKLFIVVDDTTEAFIALAKTRRMELMCPVVGVTGSVGKTSTKEMLRNILAEAGLRAYVSYKNFNSVYGVSYNLLMIPDDVQVVVLEMGISQQAEMRQNADIVRPDYAIITTIGHAHMQGLGGSVQAISYEKRQIFSFFGPENIGIINGDNPLLDEVHYAHPVARFGLKTKNQVQARRVKVEHDADGNATTRFILKWYGSKVAVSMSGNHQGMLNNALAAATAAYFLKIPLDALVRGIESYKGFDNRFELAKIAGGKGLLINDCYNANPESMRAALDAFAQIKKPLRKVAVLGDMLELGERELFWHRQVGKVVSKVDDLQALILVGHRAREIAKSINHTLEIIFVDDWAAAVKPLQEIIDKEPSLVLVKASRGIQLDKMVSTVIEK